MIRCYILGILLAIIFSIFTWIYFLWNFIVLKKGFKKSIVEVTDMVDLEDKNSWDKNNS